MVDFIDFPEYNELEGGCYTHRFTRNPDKYWIIAEVTAGHEIERAKFVNTRPTPTAVEVRNREIALLYAGTNLRRKSGEPIIPLGATVEEVEEVLKEFQPLVLNELWIVIGRLNSRWGPELPRDWQEPVSK